jgi:hypothetical protein
MIKSLKLEEGKVWKYDPSHIISSLGVAIRSTPYVHETNFKLEGWLIKNTRKKFKRLWGNHVLSERHPKVKEEAVQPLSTATVYSG